VTAIVPAPKSLLASPAPAGAAVLNGAGETTAFRQVSEWGVVETPIHLTATMAVGRVYDGAVAALFAATDEAREEAVRNALWFARDVTGRDGRTVRALPRDHVIEILSAHRRLAR
jgi:L-aminopeptidase/D-esterase-like protein